MGDYTSKRNDNFKIALQVKAVPTGGSTPIPIPITGWKFWFTVKRYVSDPDSYAVFQGTNLDGSGAVTIVNDLIGQITAEMPSIATKLFPDLPTTLIYDVQAKDTFGKISTIDSGTIVIDPDVTQST